MGCYGESSKSIGVGGIAQGMFTMMLVLTYVDEGKIGSRK